MARNGCSFRVLQKKCKSSVATSVTLKAAGKTHTVGADLKWRLFEARSPSAEHTVTWSLDSKGEVLKAAFRRLS